MSEEQKLSRFILGLEGKLADEVESLRPISLADALIRAKSKLNSFLRGNFAGNRKRDAPYDPPVPYRLPKAPFAPTFEQAKPPSPRPPILVKPMQVKALPVTQSGRSIQCYECKEWGHKRVDCPKAKLKAPTRPPLPPQRKAFLTRNQGVQNRQTLGQPPKATTVNYVSVKEEMEEQAQVYAALDPSGYNRQFSILEVQGDYEGKTLSFLVESGSLHSFLSPNTIKRLQLHTKSTGHKLRASLANGSTILMDEQTINLPFQIEGNPSSHKFRVLKMGKFQGILGMDWLSLNHADINCNRGIVSFLTIEGKRVLVQGKNGKTPL